MTTQTTHPHRAALADAGRAGAEALKGASRSRAKAALSRGGARVADLDRNPVAHRALLSAVPAAMQRLFNPDACKDLDAVFELRIPRKDGRTDVLALDVTYGHLEVRPGAAANAGAWVSIGGDDMVRLVSGVEPWPQMLADGRLELGGDPFLALRFPVVFKLPSGEP